MATSGIKSGLDSVRRYVEEFCDRRMRILAHVIEQHHGLLGVAESTHCFPNRLGDLARLQRFLRRLIRRSHLYSSFQAGDEMLFAAPHSITVLKYDRAKPCAECRRLTKRFQ